MKGHNASGNGATAVGNLTTTSAPGDIEGGILSSSLGKTGSAILTRDDSKGKSSNNTGASSGTNGVNPSGYGSMEVDEDGYSIQPAKETAWEQTNDNGISIRVLFEECV